MNSKIFICSIIFTLTLFVNARTEYALPKKIVSISGKLLQSTGKPLAYTEIELVPLDSEKQINDGRLLATTSLSGLFSFVNVPDGRYSLSINFDEKPTETSPYPTFFYPNATNRAEAEIFEIDAAAKIKAIVFRLPPKLVQRKITGVVIGADGKPIADAFVFLKDIEYADASFAFSHKTDRAGSFKINGFENRRYYIAAILLDKLPSNSAPPGKPIAIGRTPTFILDANNADFTLVLKKVAEKRELLDKNVGVLILER
jgi:hypothetical protein